MKKIIGMLLLVGLLAGMLAGCGVQRPAIKEAKFDFTVTYELDGAVKTVSGVYACKYDGISWALDSGRTRSWKGQVEGVETTGVGDDIKLGTTEDGGNIILALAFYPSYFMGDMEMEAPVPYLVVEYPATEGQEIKFFNDANTIAENFGAKIVSYEYDAPIVNTFGKAK